MAGLFSRQKEWEDGDTLTEPDLEAEFDHIYDSIVAGTTSAVGLVQLEDSHASTSITKAACPKNIKAAYDLAGTMTTKATWNANSVVKADDNNTPIVMTVGEQTLVGRITAGSIAALTPTQTRTLINVEDAADVTDAVNVASSTHGVAAKASMVNADEVGLMDSAASWVLKKFTFTNLKAFLKTYFDTLYNKYVHPNHSGPVTSAADGATTITDKAVTLAKMNDMATASLLGRNTAAIGVPEVLSKATALSLLNVEDNADKTDVTNVNAAGAVMESDYNANTFLYAVSDNTPVVKTRAEVFALLSGQSGQDFAMNTHKLTGLSVPSAAGHSMRATASITEAALETGITNDAILTKATAVLTDNMLIRGDGGTRNVQDATIMVDDNGQMTNPSQPAFSAYITAAQNDVTGDGTAYNLTGAIWTEVFDQNANFVNGTFTSPRTGRYMFTGAIDLANVVAAHNGGSFKLETTNRSYFLQYCNIGAMPFGGSGFAIVSFAVIADMDINETAYLTITVSGGTKVIDLAATYTFFQGYLIC